MVRRLDTDEKALWQRVIASVQPMHPVKAKIATKPSQEPPNAPKPVRVERSRDTSKAGEPKASLDFARDKRVAVAPGLDGHWERRINRSGLTPDISIDLHDSTLSRAYARLDGALEQGIAQKMKVILLVTGKPRAHDRTSGEGRGAIAALVRDWLAASRHATHISAVRTAHPRHGGSGALYIILKS